MKYDSQPTNVNITLDGSDNRQNMMLGKFFPCPVCGTSLGIRIARTQKPYCVCMDCGIQIFFRGKAGIARLLEDPGRRNISCRECSGANIPSVLFNRIQYLKRRKSELEAKQGLIIPDPDLRQCNSCR